MQWLKCSPFITQLVRGEKKIVSSGCLTPKSQCLNRMAPLVTLEGLLRICEFICPIERTIYIQFNHVTLKVALHLGKR